jgi:ubiquinone/menaquinone biosynthesis C-methylase UbiE
MIDLNVGVGDVENVSAPFVFDCLNIDVQRLPHVDVVCDVLHLPFKNKAFRDVFCFHVLEHTQAPAKGLAELVRVGSRLVKIEVPHRFGVSAKSHRQDKGKVGLWHTCSFRSNWFHQCLRNYRRCVTVFYEFPRNLVIHVWIYLELKVEN